MYKEAIKNLMEANKDDSDMLDFVESRVNSFVKYVDYVNFMELRMQRLKTECVTGEEWRDAVAPLDEARRSKHEVALAAVTQLNRLCVASNLPLFYDKPVDDAHRFEVGNLCQAVVDEYFEGRFTNELKITDLMDNAEAFAGAVENLGTQGECLVQ